MSTGSARFSAISIHNGQVHLKDGDIDAQSRDVFAKVDALLVEAGTGLDRLIPVQIWLRVMADQSHRLGKIVSFFFTLPRSYLSCVWPIPELATYCA